jgi:hypothetical protein
VFLLPIETYDYCHSQWRGPDYEGSTIGKGCTTNKKAKTEKFSWCEANLISNAASKGSDKHFLQRVAWSRRVFKYQAFMIIHPIILRFYIYILSNLHPGNLLLNESLVDSVIFQ